MTRIWCCTECDWRGPEQETINKGCRCKADNWDPCKGEVYTCPKCEERCIDEETLREFRRWGVRP